MGVVRMSCPDGWYEDVNRYTHAVEVTGKYIYRAFVWRCELEWTVSECVPFDCTCTYQPKNQSIDSSDPFSHAVETSTYWSYDGTVASDIDHYSDSSDSYYPYVELFRQDKFSGSNLFGAPQGSANPHAELRGKANGNGTTIQVDADI